MKIRILLGAIICAAFLYTTSRAEDAPASSAPAEKPVSHIELFNGKDYTGWTFFMRSNAAPENSWSMSNGIMHCTGRPNGYARTVKDYRDYKLTVEWRFVKVTPKADNSGVLVHMQLPDKVWPKTVECQGQHNHQGDFWMQGGATCKDHETKETRHVVMQAPSSEKSVGEWNIYEIECSDHHIKFFVNNTLMNEAAECNVSSGAIGIQSEGGEIEVRKICLDPLKGQPYVDDSLNK